MIYKLKAKKKRDVNKWHRHFVLCRIIENTLVVCQKAWRRGDLCVGANHTWMKFEFSLLDFDALPEKRKLPSPPPLARR